MMMRKTRGKIRCWLDDAVMVGRRRLMADAQQEEGRLNAWLRARTAGRTAALLTTPNSEL